MIHGKRVVVVLPAYNAARTLERTYSELPHEVVDETCYRNALERGADVVIMVHPDYQYTPALVTAMASMVALGIYDAVLGSRMLGKSALSGGMPLPARFGTDLAC